MITEPQTTEEFASWLASKTPPVQLAQLLRAYKATEKFCMSRKIILKPLFETTDFELIKKVRQTVEQDKIFRIIHRKQIEKIESAVHYYYTFIKEGNFNKAKSIATNGGRILVPQPNIEPIMEHTIAEEPFVRNEQDRRLLNKYPVIYKRVFASLNEMNKSQQSGVTAVAIYDYINHVARCADVEDILNNASWAKCKDNKKYVFSEEVVTWKIVVDNTAETAERHSKWQRVDFSQPELCTETRPLACTISGQPIEPSKWNWSQLLVAITEWLISSGNIKFLSLLSEPIYGRNNFLMLEKAENGTCAQLSNGKWIYTNYNSRNIITIIKTLCQYCGVDLDAVDIIYEPKDDASVKTAQSHSDSTSSTVVIPLRSFDPLIVKRLTNILTTRFSNGYRLNSSIETARFRSFALEDFGEELTLSDDELKTYIAACGTAHEGKVYAVSGKTKERIKELAENYFADGAQAIFFAEFYIKNENWLFGKSVISEDMLIGILRKLFPKLSFTQTYFGYTKASVLSVLESEILRVWGDSTLMSYDQLATRLQYVPLKRIKNALSQNADFIWNSVGTFSHVSQIEITEKERNAIRKAITEECDVHGYASIIDMPLKETKEHNHELSTNAIHNAVHRICLADKFDKKGKIITRKGDVFDALTVMKEYCRTIDRCSIEDLFKFEKRLTGEVHYWMPMEAGNAVLIRINKNTYVADRYVHFDIELADEAIALIVKNDYLPLQSFTTFGTFPDCGQIWNLFLLESYCRRFSREFRFDVLSVNSMNAGAVIRKSCSLDYIEIMTDAVVNSNVPLKSTTISHFLLDRGYIGRKNTAKVNNIIEKAKIIRKGRG
jgi:hypothetical protein